MFGHKGPPGPGALLLIHMMYVYGAAVFAFGIYCLVKGVKEWFK
jgi:hypothetical protein